MRAKTYAVILTAAAALLFLSVAAANVIIDPWRVFDVTFLPRPADTNDRYERFRAYVAAPDRYKGLVLASSRGHNLPHDDLARLSGVNYARFAIAYGRIEDHAAVLEFVLRDRAARGTRLRTVFLLIDIDSFGEWPKSGDPLQLAQPPAISGDAAARFWWRNLTSIQFAAWRRAIRGRIPERPAAGDLTAAAPAAPAPADAQSAASGVGATSPAFVERITERRFYESDMRLWSRIVALCRDKDVRLIAAISPVAPQRLVQLDPTDVAKAVDEITGFAPVWDFSGMHEPSARPELWVDETHFIPFVGRMMIDRIFGTAVPAEWNNFGHLHGQQVGTFTGP